jgi:hypothetical protein
MGKIVERIWVGLTLMVFLSGSGNFPVQALSIIHEDATLDVEAIVLKPEDLLPICDWQEGVVWTQKMAEGISVSTSIICGSPPNIYSIDQMVIVTGHVLRPGEANYFFYQRDLKGIDLPVDVGDWAKSVRMPQTQWGIVFTKANAAVYIGVGSGYKEEDTYDYNNVVELAEVVEKRIPEIGLPTTFEIDESAPEAAQEWMATEPSFQLDLVEEGIQILNIGNHLGQIRYSAAYTEPYETRIQLVGQLPVIRWDLPAATNPNYLLNDPNQLGLRSVAFAHPLYEFFLPEGDYALIVMVNDTVIMREEIMIQH